MSERPPNYPFVDDEILYTSLLPDEFDPTRDSYFALGRMPEAIERDMNGKIHTNDYRLVFATPAKGIVSFEINDRDAESLFCLLTTLFDDANRSISLDWANLVTGTSSTVWAGLSALDATTSVDTSEKDTEEVDTS